MSTTTTEPVARSARDAGLLSRILDEGFGEGAWHGADLRQAIDDVTSEAAFWRPAPDRHNIAEVTLHHAFYVRSVFARLGGSAPDPFLLEGEDWFELEGRGKGKVKVTWPAVRDTLATEQQRLAQFVSELDGSRARSALTPAERLDVILGITCHAIYHAGQIQLLKRLRGD
jgi:hypothetical protein